jgi:hypothetical protein
MCTNERLPPPSHMTNRGLEPQMRLESLVLFFYLASISNHGWGLMGGLETSATLAPTVRFFFTLFFYSTKIFFLLDYVAPQQRQ